MDITCSGHSNVGRSDFSPSAQDLYVVELERHPGDHGVALIIRANSERLAKVEAARRFPEYRRYFSKVFVHLLDYAELDWDTGQSYVVKLKRRPTIPAFKVDEANPSHVRENRDEGGA